MFQEDVSPDARGVPRFPTRRQRFCTERTTSRHSTCRSHPNVPRNWLWQSLPGSASHCFDSLSIWCRGLQVLTLSLWQGPQNANEEMPDLSYPLYIFFVVLFRPSLPSPVLQTIKSFFFHTPFFGYFLSLK